MGDYSFFDMYSVALVQDSQVIGTPSTGGASESAPGANPGGGDGAAQSPAGGSSFFLIMIVMMVGLIALTMMSGRKEKKRHASLIGNLQKKDKVRAAGGIIGTIVEIKSDELLLETDRASNTRIRVARGSVTSVLSGSSDGASADPSTETVKN